MLKRKIRNRNKTVTDKMPVLIAAAPRQEPDGLVFVRESVIKDGELIDEFQPVMIFTPPAKAATGRVLGAKGLERVTALGRLLALSQGKPVDYELVGQGFLTLVQTVLTEPQASRQARHVKDDKEEFGVYWLHPLWNEEIKSARIVLWAPMEAKVGGPSEPAIFCPDQVTAFLVHVLLRRTKVCPGCGILFTPGRSNQQHHDYLCGVRHRMARMRLKKKKKKAKGKHHAK